MLSEVLELENWGWVDVTDVTEEVMTLETPFNVIDFVETLDKESSQLSLF